MANQLLTKTTTPTLTWAAISGALQYQAQFCADQRFSSNEQDITGLVTASVTPAALTNAQKHYWRFRALLSNTHNADQTNATGAGTGNALRDAAARTYLAQGVIFGVSSPVSRVALSLKKTGTPTGNCWVEIWTSSGGVPIAITGAASPNQDVSLLTGAYVTYNFTFTAPVVVTAGTLYFIVLRGDSAIDGVNYVQWQTDAAGSYASGAAFKGDGTPSWTTNGAPDQIFTTYYYTWGTWQPMRSIWINTSFAVAVAPTAAAFVFVDPDDTTDTYTFAVAPGYDINPKHQRRTQTKNIQGDLLTEYVSTRDQIELAHDEAYVAYDQAAEILRFFHKRKALFLLVLLDYSQDLWERVFKVDFVADPEIKQLAPGRNDFFKMRMQLEESALT